MKTTAAAEARLFYWHEPLHKGINGDILFVFVKRETMTYVYVCMLVGFNSTIACSSAAFIFWFLSGNTALVLKII